MGPRSHERRLEEAVIGNYAISERGVPIDPSGGLETDQLRPDEVLDPASVEVRFGDPMVAAPRLLQLFVQPSVVEHLEGIVPSSYIETDPNTQQQKIIPATTVDDIREKNGWASANNEARENGDSLRFS